MAVTESKTGDEGAMARKTEPHATYAITNPNKGWVIRELDRLKLVDKIAEVGPEGGVEIATSWLKNPLAE